MTASLPVLSPAFPELLLAVGAMALLMLGAYRGERATPTVNIISILLLLAAALIAARIPGDVLTTFGGSFVLDRFARFMKVLAFIGAAAAILLSINYLSVERMQKFEYSILILLSCVGMGMMISASDLIALYLGFELMSLALYVVAASDRDWTVFRPPYLTNGGSTGRYRIALDSPLPRARSVSRADLAAAMLAAVKDPTPIGNAVTIAV